MRFKMNFLFILWVVISFSLIGFSGTTKDLKIISDSSGFQKIEDRTASCSMGMSIAPLDKKYFAKMHIVPDEVGHFRLDYNSLNYKPGTLDAFYEKTCDVVSVEAIAFTEKSLRALLNNQTNRPAKLSLEIPFRGETMIRRWSFIISKSSEWTALAKSENKDTKSYTVVEKLLMSQGLFDEYKETLQKVGYTVKFIKIEKLDSLVPDRLPNFKSELISKGFSKNKPLPFPLGFWFEAEKQKEP